VQKTGLSREKWDEWEPQLRGTRENHEKPDSEQPVSRPRFESVCHFPDTGRKRYRLSRLAPCAEGSALRLQRHVPLLQSRSPPGEEGGGGTLPARRTAAGNALATPGASRLYPPRTRSILLRSVPHVPSSELRLRLVWEVQSESSPLRPSGVSVLHGSLGKKSPTSPVFLRDGRPRSRGSIPGLGRRFFSPPQRPDRHWGLPSPLQIGYW
jgi:hypothetical protein